MDKDGLKAAQAKLLKIKSLGFLVYYLDKKNAGDDTEGHNVIISKKAAEATQAFKEHKKTDSKASRGALVRGDGEFLCLVAAGDEGRLSKGLRKLASKGAPVMKTIRLVTEEEFNQAKNKAGSEDGEDVPSTPASAAALSEEELLARVDRGEDLSPEELSQLLNMTVPTEVISEFDQDMLNDFLSPDLDAEAELEPSAAFLKLKGDLERSQQAFNEGLKAIYKDSSDRAAAAGLSDQLAGVRDKLRGARLTLEPRITSSLEQAGEPGRTGVRKQLKASCAALDAYIRTEPAIQVLRAYPYVSLRTQVKDYLMVLEKIEIQANLMERPR